MVGVPIMWVWFFGFGLSRTSNSYLNVHAINFLISLFSAIFEITGELFGFGGLGIAIALMVVGSIGIYKVWGKIMCRLGALLVFIYLVSMNWLHMFSFFSHPEILRFWFCIEILPVLLFSYYLTAGVEKKIRETGFKD